MRTLSIFLSTSFTLTALALVGCGGGVDVSGTGGSSSTTTSTSTTTTTATTTTTTGTTTSATTSTGVGGGSMCGGIGNIPCAATEYCDYPDDTCGASDGSGTCKTRVTACPEFYSPTCACDGKVYGNPCEANGAGFDINDNGGCPPPAGMFSCGSSFCDAKTSYCQRSTSDVGGEPSSYACKSLPASCGGAPSCACLSAEVCGSICAPTSDGKGFVITCPGG